MTHYAGSDMSSSMDKKERSEMLKTCLRSLWKNTKYPYELIVVDNGGSAEDSWWLYENTDVGSINTYIRNSRNMNYAYARNQALLNAHGDYICIIDNDLELKSGWLSACVSALEAFPNRRLYATPLAYPTVGDYKSRYIKGNIATDTTSYTLDSRAGSNCFVIRSGDMSHIGGFDCHRMSGSKWADRATKLGFYACIVPGNLAVDRGLRRGYNMRNAMPIKKVLQPNKQEVYFNEDEYRKEYPNERYLRFNK